jgi:hypothetical protein
MDADDSLPGSGLVLQLIENGDANESAFRLDKVKELKLVAYNFGQTRVRGEIKIEGATGASGEIHIPPGEREERTIKARLANIASN